MFNVNLPHRMKKKYDQCAHLRRFGAWSATRAIAMFTKNIDVKTVHDALIAIKLDSRISRKRFTTRTSYDIFHKEVIKEFKTACRSKGLDLSYGKACKAVAVYLKVVYVISGSRPDIAHYAHPPIDREMIGFLGTSVKNSYPWTQLTDTTYYTVYQTLEDAATTANILESEGPRWMLEELWLRKLKAK